MAFSGYYRKRDIAGTAECKRLQEKDLLSTWRQWGPYLSDRSWATIREEYKGSGARVGQWGAFPHEHARSRAYRWVEDGIFGISDLRGLVCFSVALWNEADPILKERLFGLTNPEGNHGEDVKEAYFYLDNLPSHAYMKGLYRYPYLYPYHALTHTPRPRSSLEYELHDTGALDEHRYFDVSVEYAKAAPEDILVRITAVNQGPEPRTLHLLPTILFRNTWSWGEEAPTRPALTLADAPGAADSCIAVSSVRAADPLTQQEIELLPARWLHCRGCREVLFTNNETNNALLFHSTNASPYVKDGINDHVVSRAATVNPAHVGTKAAAHYVLRLAPGEARTVDLRLTDVVTSDPFSAAFEATLASRRSEADEFYDAISPYRRTGGGAAEEDLYRVQRQAFAGMLWSKQLNHMVVQRYLGGDRLPDGTELKGAEENLAPWGHFYMRDIVSLADKWEFPSFAVWDLAFHTTTLAIIDPAFAKHQLELMLMEWVQHPDGQLPAYEQGFSGKNPPVHAWAAWRVFQTEREIYGVPGDVEFLARVFGKLSLNFTWWVNCVDDDENSIFEGGFLGMDNIRVDVQGPDGKQLEQADGTAWMAMYCLNMLRMAIHLAATRGGNSDLRAFQFKDAARKYLQHFMYICDAMNRLGSDDEVQGGLWDEKERFFMDRARGYGRLHVFSMTGLVPLFAVEEIVQPVDTADPESFYDLFGFLRWFARNRRDLVADNAHLNLDALLAQVKQPTVPKELRGCIGVVKEDKLRPILARMLDPAQFLSPHGVRSLSKYHLDHTKVFLPGRGDLSVVYEPAESIQMQKMGGNSNWCGPVWMPMNYLLVQSLRKLHRMVEPGFTVPHPGLGGKACTLAEIADDLEARLIGIFLRDPETGTRPVFGGVTLFQQDPLWRDHLLFYEYFHGGEQDDSWAGAGLGASHQTGWTGLVANLIQERGVRQRAAELGITEDPETP